MRYAPPRMAKIKRMDHTKYWWEWKMVQPSGKQIGSSPKVKYTVTICINFLLLL